MANRWGNSERLYFGGFQKSLQMVTAAMKLKDICFLEEKLWPTETVYWKWRHSFANKGPSSQSYGFSSSHTWMWELDHKEKLSAKKWMLLNCGAGEDIVPWTARRSNQSILKKISPEFSLEGLMLKLKLQYFGHLMWRTDSLEKTLMLEKIEGRRGRGRQSMRWLDGITNSMDMSFGTWGSKESGTTERLNWTEPLSVYVHN